MRINKPGDLSKIKTSWSGVWKCPDCGCEWQLTPQDPEPKFVSDPRPGESAHYMNCPTCGNTVYR